MKSGLLTIQQIDPAELTPGQFSAAILAAVHRGAKMVVIDSLNGYLQAMPDERFMTTYLHEILTFLGQHQVGNLMVRVQQGMLGGNMSSDGIVVGDVLRGYCGILSGVPAPVPSTDAQRLQSTALRSEWATC